MAQPEKMKLYPERDLKLGIKSSFPNVQASLALLYLLWKSNDRVASLSFSKQLGDEIQLSDDCANKLTQLAATISAAAHIPSEDLIAVANGNQIFKSQLEALQVAFELIWKVAKVDFSENRPASSERTKVEGRNVRYPKIFSFTTNMDLLDLLVEQDRETYLAQLLSWATGQDYGGSDIASSSLEKMYTVFSEGAVYRVRTSGIEDIKFQNWGIYFPLANGESSVDIGDYKEAMGPLRILKPALESGMNPFIQATARNTNVSIRTGVSPSEFKSYTNRVATYHELVSTKINVSINQNALHTSAAAANAAGHLNEIGFSRNRIVFGAPGTGKSYRLEHDRGATKENGERLFPDDLFERVTFHPNYSYAQFVGCYKPAPKIDDSASPPEYITYEYVPGPFVRALVKAWNNQGKNCLLIIEEINRANVAGTFGDIFQLLDRGSDGVSEYAISVSEELKTYLDEQAPGLVSSAKQLQLPGNLYLWATMNSADQGVSPVDTAFKRRWSFEFIPINYNEDELGDRQVVLKYGVSIEWNHLRRAINRQLISGSMGVTEDKLIGPFFLSSKELEDDSFDDAFKSKLLMYLYEDVLKRRRGGFFKPDIYSFSELIRAYDDGERIFDFEISQEQAIDDSSEVQQ